jgi:AcrR family transcriptional regulator
MFGKTRLTVHSKQSRRGSERRIPLPSRPTPATVDRILKGASRVLIDYGYAEFTVRRVAEVVGMTVGNLTYHFPSKRELLRALIVKLLADYNNRFGDFLSAPTTSASPGLEPLIRWAFTDTIAVETVHTMRELWAIALHDAVIKSAIDDFYDQMMVNLVQMLQQMRPRVSVRTIRELVQFMTIMAEGTNVFFGTRRVRAVSHNRIVAIALQLVKTIAPDFPL